MAEDDESSGSKASWHEREIALALQRLATARANLAPLEEQAGTTAVRPEPDPADVARATELQAEVTKLISKASGRFGASSARAKLEVAQRELRVVLDRLGVDRLDQVGSAPPPPAVDPAVLDFARRECAAAEQAFLEVAAMVIPDADLEPEVADAEVIAVAESFGGDGDLDLRIEPSAAS